MRAYRIQNYAIIMQTNIAHYIKNKYQMYVFVTIRASAHFPSSQFHETRHNCRYFLSATGRQLKEVSLNHLLKLSHDPWSKPN